MFSQGAVRNAREAGDRARRLGILEDHDGMPSRLHERNVYTREGDGWRTDVLNP